MNRFYCSLLILLCTQLSYAQTNKELAAGYAKEALIKTTNGKTDEAIKLLKKAQQLDPSSIFYPYEISIAYYKNKDYNGAIAILEKLRTHKTVFSKVFQLLGNSYDMIKQPEKAVDVYNAGLLKFPKAGELWLELGNIALAKRDFDKAIFNYEKGIEVDPLFPSNYYWAARLFCNSTDKVWGMIYGEMFMIFEHDSKRAGEISKLLYDTYKTQIRFYADSTYAVNFSRFLKKGDTMANKPSFVRDVYEPLLLSSIKTDRSISLASLSRIRANFIEAYFKESHYLKYPNPLFDFQYKVFKAGHMQAYSYWLLSKGDEDGFVNWTKDHNEQMQRFMAWLLKVSLPLDDKYKFLSTQY